MQLRVDRYLSNEEATLSKIYLDGVFLCFGLEDQYQEVKVPDETRIPAGIYNIKLRTEGGLTKRYADRYSFHRGMLHVQNVPGFTYVYIHTGNNDDHTSAPSNFLTRSLASIWLSRAPSSSHVSNGL